MMSCCKSDFVKSFSSSGTAAPKFSLRFSLEVKRTEGGVEGEATKSVTFWCGRACEGTPCGHKGKLIRKKKKKKN